MLCHSRHPGPYTRVCFLSAFLILVRRSENLPSCVYPVHLAIMCVSCSFSLLELHPPPPILSLILFFLILFLYLSLTYRREHCHSSGAIHRSINTNSLHIHKQVLFTGQHQLILIITHTKKLWVYIIHLFWVLFIHKAQQAEILWFKLNFYLLKGSHLG